jgi:assimilatory nitrate reductase catalytic subunit
MDKAGLKVVDLYHAVETGEVKSLWVLVTNPAVSMPDTNQLGGALPHQNPSARLSVQSRHIP